ncbi:probable hexosyltransferase MUCI70 isoform X2 [Zingiber officinale]|uniref:probable hexosyltransferase MUCI70 isoform X2 n=1 Tax=Zingiber officinale TaxID=94328 RepID=UPI001C4B0B34|nr:probable hexosyltransferase MUCI70 isoform X2 [Zingiber officinale]
MAFVYVTTPLLFQSKLLCLSLLYLLATLPLALYVSFSKSTCLFRSPTPFPTSRRFSYPPSYSEHKYSLPTAHSDCSSSVPFSDYGEVLDEIRDRCRNSTSSPVLRYLEGKGDSFSGNFSAQKRKSFFRHRHGDQVAIPCGFLQEFPVKESDRLAMEKCDGVVVVSAIMGDHDKVRQPRGLGSHTLASVCFFMFIDHATRKVLVAHDILSDKEGEVNMIGVWRIVTLRGGRLPYDSPAMNGVIPKHLVHRLFPNSKFSVWLDAKVQLTVDPLLLIHSLLVLPDADTAIPKHPFNTHTMEEAVATARWKKWADVESLRVQMETYCENGLQPWSTSKLPYETDVPDSALILRRHGLRSNLFSCLLFNELGAFNYRDQLAFAYVRDLMVPKIKINMFEFEVFEHVTVEYRHNLRPEGSQRSVKMASSRDVKGSSCDDYLLKMSQIKVNARSSTTLRDR